jgi:uncharacterized protein (DUF342 family)
MSEDSHLKYLSIRLGEDGRAVMACFSPEGDVEEITLSHFRKAIETAGFGECDLDEDALLEATGNYNDRIPFELAIGAASDGEFFIKIDDGQLSAYLTCFNPRGGIAVTLESILEEAKDKEITVDLDMEAIKRAISEEGDSVLIASGKPAEDGLDSSFESLLPEMKERVPKIDEEGIANFRDLGGILVVHQGDSLMRRHPAGAGEPGFTISGTPIPAKEGVSLEFTAGLEGAEIDSNDSDLLIAKIDGCPYLIPNGVKVEPVYTIKNVDLHTGNIDFLGTVIVTGEVQSGMTIKADGDIHIKGSTEGARLIAKGDIVVIGGLIGHPEKLENELTIDPITEAGGSVNANFTQNAVINAGQGIFIRDYTMMCTLTAAVQIIVGDGSRSGHIIGGVATAGMLVKAKTIGSPSRSRTVVISRTSDSLYARMAKLSESRDDLKVRRFKVRKLIDLAANKPDRVSASALESANSTLASLDDEEQQLNLDEVQLKKEIAASRGAMVKAEQHFLEGVEVRVGTKRTSTTKDRSGGTYRLKDDELIFE